MRKLTLLAFCLFLASLVASTAGALEMPRPKEGVYHLTGILLFSDEYASITVNPMTSASFKIKIKNKSFVKKTLNADEYVGLVDADVNLTDIYNLNYGAGRLLNLSRSHLKRAPAYDSTLHIDPAFTL